MNFIFFSCILEERQLWFEEPFLLAASEVVRAACKAGFQNSSDYVFEYAQPPKGGMFLFKVTRKTDGFSSLVFFDTRTKPNFIWVENVFDNELDITIQQFVNMLGTTLRAASYAYGWKVWLEKYVPNELQDLKLFHEALEYVESYMKKEVILNIAAFRAIVISDDISDDVMALVKKYMKGKKITQTSDSAIKGCKSSWSSDKGYKGNV